MKNVAPSDYPSPTGCWSNTHFQKAMSLWNSQPSFTTFCIRFLDLAFLCRSVRRKSCQTKYLPALTTYVRCHNLPAVLNASCARAYCFDLGQSFALMCLGWHLPSLSLVVEIRIVCVLMVKPSASTIEFQSVLFFGANIGTSSFFPDPNSLT